MQTLDRALPGLVDPLVAGGLLERSGGEVRALVDVRPYADDDRDWWVVSDLTPGLDGGDRRMDPDHVLGVSSASTSLAQLTIREPVGRALDLGTGSGVQALHLSGHAVDVVATDLSERCVALARLTVGAQRPSRSTSGSATCSSRSADDPSTWSCPTRRSSSPRPPGSARLPRLGACRATSVVRRVLVDGAARLTDGGWCQVLANWAHHAGQPWEERTRRLDRRDGVRRLGGPARTDRPDAGTSRCGSTTPASRRRRSTSDRYDAWLDVVREQRIEAVGFGWLNLRNAGRADPVLRLEEWPYDIEQPIGPHVAAWGRQVDAASAYDRRRQLARPTAWSGRRTRRRGTHRRPR